MTVADLGRLTMVNFFTPLALSHLLFSRWAAGDETMLAPSPTEFSGPHDTNGHWDPSLFRQLAGRWNKDTAESGAGVRFSNMDATLLPSRNSGNAKRSYVNNSARRSYRLSADVSAGSMIIADVWFQVRKNGMGQSYPAFKDENAPNWYYVDIPDMEEGTYKWRVKATVRSSGSSRSTSFAYSPIFSLDVVFDDGSTSSSAGAPTKAPTDESSAAPAFTSVPKPSPAPTSDEQGVRYGLQKDCRRVDTSQFNICLDLKSASGSYEPWMDAFVLARNRWQEVITDDGDAAVDITSFYPKSNIGTQLPPKVDDIYVSVIVLPIDGPDQILGMAGPLVLKESGGKYRPVGSMMKFDLVDVESMAEDVWEAVILHELGHALGFGALFKDNGLNDGSTTSDKYLGTNAAAEWEKLCPGGSLPIETDGGDGTAGVHWDETCLNGELMTGYLSPDAMQMSRITIAAMKDMGYGVDFSVADEYTRDDLGVCGIYCPNLRRNLRPAVPQDSTTSSSAKRNDPVSEEGHKLVLSAAAAEMHRNRLEAPSKLPDGVRYMAAESITVFIRDFDGQVKEERVTYAEVKDYLPDSRRD